MKWFVGCLGLCVVLMIWSVSCSPTNPGTEPGAESSTGTETTTADVMVDSGTGNPDTTGAETVADTATSATVPTNGADLLKFLQDGKYKSWAKESKVHGATLGSPHGPVLVYVNDILDQSMKSGSSTHPVGSASVKELYQSDMTTLNGYAVMVKATAGSGGNTWYWYEKIGANVVADSTGAGICTGCHTPGKDYFRTEYPLK